MTEVTKKYIEVVGPLMTYDLLCFMKEYANFYVKLHADDDIRVSMNFHRQLLSDNLRDHGVEAEDIHAGVLTGMGWDLCETLIEWWEEKHKHTDKVTSEPDNTSD